MKKILRLGLCGVWLFSGLALANKTTDVKGSWDHPLVGRFADSLITNYSVAEFDESRVRVAKGSSGKNKDTDGFETLEGKVTRIAYVLPEKASIAQAARSFENQLLTNGFEPVFLCKNDKGKKDCGGVGAGYALEYDSHPGIFLNPFAYRVVTMHHSDKGVRVQVIVSNHKGNKRVYAQVNVIEQEKFVSKMVDARQIEKSLKEIGKMAFYGVYFDTNKASIKPESDATLAVMADFLKSTPDLKVVIVGHTDNQGTLEANIQLSQARAKAVVQKLVKTYAIAKARISHAGVAFLAPVAPNTSEEGRAKNRRVEMLAR